MSNSPSTYWGKKPFLENIAKQGMLVQCGCRVCRRMRTYLASDLAEFMGGRQIVGRLFNGCPYCGASHSWYERYRHPNNDDVGNTIIHRLKGWRQTAIWADEFYAPDVKQEKLPGMWGG